ncbi:Laccase domain protein YfiH [Labrenzia sp. THAF191b]|jgi:YfiH family protein|uniref:peptidoglycan editing factor PgeF n=1 Tax=unclassified Labrenzia TaxID=2648686 RepID=UPI0012695F67|nr:MULTISPECIES: peptidoglycan editing factor PgeF [unclassified Labrenzia]QFS98457.1 Laccase domain protein YfiH [Labrenzia sp. THAF191b]QFT04771.1 Laccase domain protein YfiH [Labrenzia sp. THAF191a]QFT16315.1 Laccase domain protein YfiH [Labrenzia sp. THAF187b]
MKIEADVLKLDGIRHGFFTRQGGVSGGIYTSLNIGLGSDDERSSVLENRGRVADQLGIGADRLVSPYQIHSADVITVSAPFAQDADRKADALVTATPGLAIGIATADCGPLLFADTKAGVIGAAHSGWKGAVTGILQNTVAAMEALGATRTNITAVLGPTISQGAYEVGPEFKERFLQEHPDNTRYFKPSERAEHFMFDLPAFITDKLQALGLGAVADLALCTYADEDRFFSYRRTTHRKEPDYGRQISAIALL